MINYVRNICFFLSLGIFSSYSQHNLVVNPSFEDTLHCPFMAGQINYTNNWNVPILGGGDPDLNHSCALSSSYCGVPISTGSGYQYPKSGNSFSGLMTLTTWDGREYIQGGLYDALTSNITYCISFYVNLRNNSKYYCNSIGAYFDDGSVYASTNFGIAQGTPQIYNLNQQLDDTLKWMKIEGSFTANGTERYITIGNFLNDAMSDFDIFSNSNPTPYAYYNIDDVSVIDQSTPAYAGNDTLISVGDSVFVGRTPEIGLNEACVWYTNGIATDTIAGMWVKPTQTTTYIVEQNLCGQIDHDTVTVSIGIAGLDEVQTQNGIRLYPNPSTGEVWISTDEQGEASVEILTLNGSPVYEVEVSEISGNTKLSVNLTNGVYLLVVKTNAKKYTNRIVVVH